MEDFSFRESNTLGEAAKAKHRFPLPVLLLTLAGILSLSKWGIPWDWIAGWTDPQDAEGILTLMNALEDMLLAAAVVLFAEGRPLRSLGFTRRKAVRLYLNGCLLGLASFTVSAAIVLLSGNAEIAQAADVPFSRILLYLIAYLIQGLSEEVIFRGWMLVSAANRVSPLQAAVFSALMFASAHILNSGFTALAFLNLFINGLYAALLFLHEDSILIVAGMHSMWNFAEGILFGTSVSGYSLEPSLFEMVMKPGHALLTGGAFGIEGGLADTAVECGMLVLVLFLIAGRKEQKRIS